MQAMMTTAVRNRAMEHITKLIGQTLEEEIFTINSFAPAMTAHLPSLFSESVVDSVTDILGESSGEALLRSIGDDGLLNPSFVYEALDGVFKDGSEILKAAIREEFRVKVHQLFKMTMDMAAPALDL